MEWLVAGLVNFWCVDRADTINLQTQNSSDQTPKFPSLMMSKNFQVYSARAQDGPQKMERN